MPSQARSNKNQEIADGDRAVSWSSPSPLSTLPDEDQPPDIEDHIKSTLKGVSQLRKELLDMKQKNAILQAEVYRMYNAEDVSIQPKKGRRGGMSTRGLQESVRKLNDEVYRLQKAREKDKRKIRELKMREVERDVATLADDPSDKMRKLLRRYYHLMTSPSIEETEECGVCMETMEIGRATSLPCQHVFCNDCLSKISPGSVTVACPSCREVCTKEAVELVNFTAQQQWDALLEVAQDWAKFDRHGGNEPEDTEEEEMPFIDDDHPNTSSSSPLGVYQSVEHTENPSIAEAPATPPHDTTLDAGPSSEQDVSALSYLQSPTSVKRKRLAELAERRRLKRAR